MVPILNWTPGSSCLCQTTVSWCQEPCWVGPNLPQGSLIQTQPAFQASLYLLILPLRKHLLLRASGYRPCRARLDRSVPGPDLTELPEGQSASACSCDSVCHTLCKAPTSGNELAFMPGPPSVLTPLVSQFPARSLKLPHQVPLLPCREQIWTFLSHALFKVA